MEGGWICVQWETIGLGVSIPAWKIKCCLGLQRQLLLKIKEKLNNQQRQQSFQLILSAGQQIFSVTDTTAPVS